MIGTYWRGVWFFRGGSLIGGFKIYEVVPAPHAKIDMDFSQSVDNMINKAHCPFYAIG